MINIKHLFQRKKITVSLTEEDERTLLYHLAELKINTKLKIIDQSMRDGKYYTIWNARMRENDISLLKLCAPQIHWGNINACNCHPWDAI